MQSVSHIVNKGCGRCTRWCTLARTAEIAAAAAAVALGKGKVKGLHHTGTTNGACSNSNKQGFKRLHSHQTRSPPNSPLRDRALRKNLQWFKTTRHLETSSWNHSTGSTQSPLAEKAASGRHKLVNLPTFHSPNTSFPLRPEITESA